MAAFYIKKHRQYFKLLCWQLEHFHPKLDQFKQMAFYLFVSWLEYFTQSCYNTHWRDKGKLFLLWKKKTSKKMSLWNKKLHIFLKWSAAFFCLLFSAFVSRVTCPAGNAYHTTEYFQFLLPKTQCFCRTQFVKGADVSQTCCVPVFCSVLVHLCTASVWMLLLTSKSQ